MKRQDIVVESDEPEVVRSPHPESAWLLGA